MYHSTLSRRFHEPGLLSSYERSTEGTPGKYKTSAPSTSYGPPPNYSASEDDYGIPDTSGSYKSTETGHEPPGYTAPGKADSFAATEWYDDTEPATGYGQPEKYAPGFGYTAIGSSHGHSGG